MLSSFALSLESGVKKYDQRVEAEKKRAVRKHNDKGKENDHNINSVSTTRLLKSSSFQPHVGHLNKGNPMNAILNAIKDRGAQLSDDSPGIAPRVTTSSTDDSRQALLASIKNRRDSVPNKPPPDGVPDRIHHINNNIARKESRVLLVNRMLAKAPPSVKQGESWRPSTLINYEAFRFSRTHTHAYFIYTLFPTPDRLFKGGNI